LVNFSNGVADRTYRIDPEMDCSDTGFDPFGDGEERRAKKE
jgi:hypothetical protein